jgi:predicted Zn-ribbon and HTH transcriptional regulator
MRFKCDHYILWGRVTLSPSDGILTTEDEQLIEILKEKGYESLDVEEVQQAKETVEELTKKEIMEELDKMGVEYNPRDTKGKLLELLGA